MGKPLGGLGFMFIVGPLLQAMYKIGRRHSKKHLVYS